MSRDEVKERVMLKLIDRGFRITNEDWDIITNLKVDFEMDEVTYKTRIILSDTPLTDITEYEDSKYEELMLVLANGLYERGLIGKKK